MGGFPYPLKTWQDLDLVPLGGTGFGWFTGAGSDRLRWPFRFDPSHHRCEFQHPHYGGFHEDGLSDSVDALGGAYDRDNVLRILKDSRIGAFGALALILALALKLSLLVDLGKMAPIGLVLGQSLSLCLAS